MVRAADVFTPNSFPIYTYVERAGEALEANLTNALTVKNSLVSLSGPSKSGKTVLLKKVISSDDLIYISGSSIKAAGDLWRIVLAWTGAAVETSKSRDYEVSGGISAGSEAQAGIVIAKGSVSGGVEVGGRYGSGNASTIAHDGLIAVTREIADSSFTVFIDDFHYIPRDVQPDVAREIKAGVESGIKICVASVPHRADDVVRGNDELRGRIYAVDTRYWRREELEAIAVKGFRALNVDLANSVVSSLASEAFGSPQLMQAVCLSLCFKKGVGEELPRQLRVEVTEQDLREIYEYTSAGSNFQSLVESFHSGPRQRGTARNEFVFTDGSRGDVYRAILLAMRQDPGQLSFTYDEMQRRVRAVCNGEVPVGGSLIRSLEQIDEIASSQATKAIEWLDDVLEVIDPYFLFYLRSSRVLEPLAR